jgi:FAD:protein FMN transferase
MSKRQHHRRDFLTGKAARDSLADSIDGSPESNSPNAKGPSSAGYFLRISREAMASTFEIVLNAGEYEGAIEKATDTLDRVDELEEQLSIFRETSDISYLNTTAALKSVEIESGLFDLLKLAQEIYQKTDGAFDPTATPLWNLWGFSRRKGQLPSDQQIAEALKLIGMDQVELDDQNRSVRYRRGETELSLGSIGKGYALDCCAVGLAEKGIDHFLFHGGYSSVLAKGSRADRAQQGGWPVGVHHPLRHKQRLAEIVLRDRALATSGSEKQFFRHQGRRYSHILNPKTGWPADELLSVTVLAPTAAEADGLATAFFVLGTKKTLELVRQDDSLAVLLVEPTRGGGVRLIDEGFEPEELEIL